MPEITDALIRASSIKNGMNITGANIIDGWPTQARFWLEWVFLQPFAAPPPRGPGGARFWPAGVEARGPRRARFWPAGVEAPSHPSQNPPRLRRVVFHSALPLNQLLHPRRRPLLVPQRSRPPFQLTLHAPQVFPVQTCRTSPPPPPPPAPRPASASSPPGSPTADAPPPAAPPPPAIPLPAAAARLESAAPPVPLGPAASGSPARPVLARFGDSPPPPSSPIPHKSSLPAFCRNVT